MLRGRGKFRSGCFERGVKFDLRERFFLVGEEDVGQTCEFDCQPACKSEGDALPSLQSRSAPQGVGHPLWQSRFPKDVTAIPQQTHLRHQQICPANPVTITCESVPNPDATM